MTHGQPGSYVRFPPRWQNTLVPTTPRSALGIGMSLYTASKPRALFAQRALWAASRVLGARILPGPRTQWTPPMAGAEFAELHDQWQGLVGGRATALAIYERLQPERRALTLMVCAGSRSVLVRVRADPASLARERAITEAAEHAGITAFQVPRIAGAGAAAGYHWLAYEAISYRPHAPVYRPDGRIFAEITELVEAAVPRPPDTPAHWRGAHRDLTPWNLRRGRNRTWLIDWEDADWAPPGTDEVYFRTVAAAIHPKRMAAPVIGPEHQEARQLWARIVADRPTADIETLRARMLTLLAAPDQPNPGTGPSKHTAAD